MKKIYMLLVMQLLIINLPSSFAQVGEWAWIHGSSSPGSPGVSGTLGMANMTNEPPSVYEPCEWTDLNGNFWLYGGGGDPNGIYADLYKYDPVANEWTWVKGPGSGTTGYAGSYGVQGVPSINNYPPCKGYGVGTWTDKQGNLWMFGGLGAGFPKYNDLWMYNISTNEWTWMKGPDVPSQRGVYGTMGVPDTANNPGARSETASSWTDDAGELWLFGGYDSSYYNDLWRFNIATNTWTWMKGSQISGVPGTYGIKGVENAANTPSGREAYAHWKDSSGKLWLFSGGNYGTSFYYSDLWNFDVTTTNWTWVGGDTIANTAGIYGTRCVLAPTNLPGARWEHRASWKDTNGNFWMFGGSDPTGDPFNDLWMYCVSSGQWVWVSGADTSGATGSWGTLGIASPTNVPSSRLGSVGWTDNNGHLYLFGGFNFSYQVCNDLWKFTIDPACAVCASVVAPPVASFQVNNTAICQNDCVNFTDKSTNATSWKWSFQGAEDSTSTAQNPQNVCYLSPGNFDVTLIASNSGGSDSVTFSNYINVKTSPPTPSVTQVGTTLYCSTDPTYTSYQWYDSTMLIPGATDTSLVITRGGNYNVQVSNGNGCKIAVGINIILGLESFTVQGLQFTISPNPVQDELTITGNWNQEDGKKMLTIYNVLGGIIYTKETYNAQETLDCRPFSAGMYFIQVKTDNWSLEQRFVKE